MNAGTTCGSEARAKREKNQKQNAWKGFEEGSDRGVEAKTEKHFFLGQRECCWGVRNFS